DDRRTGLASCHHRNPAGRGTDRPPVGAHRPQRPGAPSAAARRRLRQGTVRTAAVGAADDGQVREPPDGRGGRHRSHGRRASSVDDDARWVRREQRRRRSLPPWTGHAVRRTVGDAARHGRAVVRRRAEPVRRAGPPDLGADADRGNGRSGVSARGRFDLTGPLPSGTTVIEASAGTGKTYAIAGLATRYLAEGLVDPPELMLVTFGRAATHELRERTRARIAATAAALADPRQARSDEDRLLAYLADADDEVVRLRRSRLLRSEERRVGNEGRSGGGAGQ